MIQLKWMYKSFINLFALNHSGFVVIQSVCCERRHQAHSHELILSRTTMAHSLSLTLRTHSDKNIYFGLGQTPCTHNVCGIQFNFSQSGPHIKILTVTGKVTSIKICDRRMLHYGKCTARCVYIIIMSFARIPKQKEDPHVCTPWAPLLCVLFLATAAALRAAGGFAAAHSICARALRPNRGAGMKKQPQSAT